MDRPSDKRNRFEEAYQRGQEGRVSNYEAWLQDRGIEFEKTSIDYLTQYFRGNSDITVNHEDELETIAEYAGFFARKNNVYHLPIIGVSGIGRSQFLHTVAGLLADLDTGFDQEFLTATEFSDREGDEEKIFRIRDDLQAADKVVILVDDCEWVRGESLVESLKVIEGAVEDALLLTTWTPEFWKHHREEVELVLPASTEIHLQPFTREDTLAALHQIFEAITDDGLELPEDYLKEIYEYSRGVPVLFNILAMESLRATVVTELELGDNGAVESAAEKMNLKGLEERVYDLSDTKVTILRHMLLWVSEEGIRPMQLVDLLDRDKSTVSYHLKDLTSEGLVESDKGGRSAYYHIKEPVKPMIQTRTNQESEYHGEL
jgi:predicted transcriptional regulator